MACPPSEAPLRLARIAVACLLAHALLGAARAEPLSLEKRRRLLQAFADKAYLKGFRSLGDADDCDHGHLLFAKGSVEPAAILYHTQELAAIYHLYKPGDPHDYVDPDARNWLQWTRDGKVENAAPFARTEYPRSPSWELFEKVDLPRYREWRTVTDRMLDPTRLGLEVLASVQWTFRRAPCSAAPGLIRVVLPSRETLCLLSEEPSPGAVTAGKN
jgi:hypothetical protein